MPVFSMDVKVWATVYIRAENEADALEKARKIEGCLEVQTVVGSAYPTSARRFDDPKLPEISLSPAMTLATRPASEIFPAMLTECE